MAATAAAVAIEPHASRSWLAVQHQVRMPGIAGNQGDGFKALRAGRGLRQQAAIVEPITALDLANLCNEQ